MPSYNDHDDPTVVTFDDDTKVGALADGFANSAINSTEIDEDSTGYVGGVGNGDNRDNTDVDVKADVDTNINNGDNRDNSYDWSYDSKTSTDIDTDIKTVNTNINDADTNIKSDYDWSYDSKVDIDTDTKTVNTSINDADTDIKQTSDNDTTTDSYNTAKSDTDFAVLEDVKDFGNLGIAGRDLSFDIGDDFSFNLHVDGLLNNALNGEGNDMGFSLVQANNLADQDSAYNVKMDNEGANNNLGANGGSSWGAEGIDSDGKIGWDLKAGDDVAGSSSADASAILANSGFHLEFVQGANMVSNVVDATIFGDDGTTSSNGEDSNH